MIHVRRSTAALAPLAFLACGAFSEPEGPELGVTVAPSVIESPSDDWIVVSFEVVNHGGSTAYVSACGERVLAAIDRLTDAGWVRHASDACLAIYPMVPIEIAPGDTLRGRRSIAGAGRFRLRIGARAGRDDRERWDAASNAFTIQ
ncbi:MAG TPA: hypothetical protein VF158_13225 [Longimicrobiales bacterium]